MEIISRTEAKTQGLRHYFTGKTCPNGHTAPRFVSNCGCVECSKNSYETSRKSDPERYAAYAKKYYQNNRQKCIESVKASAKKNPERVKQNKLAERTRNAERIAQYFLKWYQVNRLQVLRKAAAYRLEYSEQVKQYSKKWRSKNANHIRDWREKNADRIRDKQRERFQFRVKNDPGFKAARLVRQSLNKVLGRVKSGKRGGKTVQILGYSFDQFREHMERHFLPGMNWSNHGTIWHVDHVVPVAEMLRLGVSEPNKIHALSNLLPMYALENMRKKDSFTLSPPIMVA